MWWSTSDGSHLIATDCPEHAVALVNCGQPTQPRRLADGHRLAAPLDRLAKGQALNLGQLRSALHERFSEPPRVQRPPDSTRPTMCHTPLAFSVPLRPALSRPTTLRWRPDADRDLQMPAGLIAPQLRFAFGD